MIGGEGKIVEIDESLVFRRKYNRGRLIKEVWVVGAMERGRSGAQTNKFFIQIVSNRNQMTLTNLILQYILPGTHLISDGWAAYRRLERYGYSHSRVIHQENFVDSSDPEVHTQNVESLWSVVKRMLRRTGTNLKTNMHLHIKEKCFRYAHKQDFLDKFLELVRQKYSF